MNQFNKDIIAALSSDKDITLFEKMGREFGYELVKRYQNNARRIINGDGVPLNDMQTIKKKKRFWLF